MALRCAILDDYQNVVLKLADWSKIKGDVELKIFNAHLGGADNVIAAPAATTRSSSPCARTQARVC